jgi:hypothetical protein
MDVKKYLKKWPPIGGFFVSKDFFVTFISNIKINNSYVKGRWFKEQI